MKYVTYDEEGLLTGYYNQEILHDSYFEVDNDMAEKWVNFRMNASRDGLEPYVYIKPVEIIKRENAEKALNLQTEAVTNYTLNISKKALGLVVAEPDVVEFGTYIKTLEEDIVSPPSDEVYHPPVHPGVVVPSVGLDITMTREEGWNNTLGWRLVFEFDEADYVPANLAITIYSAAECTGYLYTPGALQIDTETGKYFALCPAGQEKGNVDYFFGLVYGSAELACWTFEAGVAEETINVI